MFLFNCSLQLEVAPELLLLSTTKSSPPLIIQFPDSTHTLPPRPMMISISVALVLTTIVTAEASAAATTDATTCADPVEYYASLNPSFQGQRLQLALHAIISHKATILEVRKTREIVSGVIIMDASSVRPSSRDFEPFVSRCDG